MYRRDFLRLSASGPLALLTSGFWAGSAAGLFGASPDSASSANWQNILVLVELKGGNDGLNTVIPYADAAYYQARPRLAIAREKVLQLDNRLGLHPEMSAMMPLWKSGKLAVALGVGYEHPNRSHFRSIDIWETASDSDQFLSQGWLSRLFEQHSPPQDFTADGILIGKGDGGPMYGSGMRTIVMDDAKGFLRKAEGLETSQTRERGALAHILGVEREIDQAVHSLRQNIAKAPALQTKMPTSRFGRDMKSVTQLIAAKVPVAVIKVSLDGFDTHSGQANTHTRLVRELAEGLAAFEKAMREIQAWDRVMVMTYSEFGRRVKENGSMGSDHGTAAPHFLLGGRIRGGFYGEQPSLKQLDGGDLRYTMDYRRLYATAAQRWWGLKSNIITGAENRPLDCIM